MSTSTRSSFSSPSSTSSIGGDYYSSHRNRHSSHRHSSKRRSSSYSCHNCHKESIPILSRERFFGNVQHFCSFGCFEQSNQSEQSSSSSSSSSSATASTSYRFDSIQIVN